MPSLKYIILSLHSINVMLKDPFGRRDHQLLQDCCWTLSYITEYNPHGDDYDDDNGNDDGLRLDVASVILDSGLADVLIELLFHSKDIVVHPALRTIGNIATGSDAVTTKLLQRPGIMEAIAMLIHKESKLAIRRETLWLISNITAGDRHQVDLIVKNQAVLQSVINVVMTNEQDCVKKEAVWAISNATANCNVEQIRAICASGGIEALVHWLMHCQEVRCITPFLCFVDLCRKPLNGMVVDLVASRDCNRSGFTAKWRLCASMDCTTYSAAD